ncbi:casein kinase II regulatory subunit-domain-containing protein [Kalaharituber pfeilii]|nr:casein kinase II regulatory subunit-domain-containing protein [Kalaharituber pfeilii]
MPPSPRHRAPQLLPVQSHHRAQTSPTSNPSSAHSSNTPTQPFPSSQHSPISTVSSGHTPLLEHRRLSTLSPQQHQVPQSHYNILLSSAGDSPIEGSVHSNPFLNPNVQQGSGGVGRLEAEAKQKEYRILNDDGDSVIDYYHTTGDERAGGPGGGLESANLSPIDFPHSSGQHSLLWLHHQQRLQQQIAAAEQQQLVRRLREQQEQQQQLERRRGEQQEQQERIREEEERYQQALFEQKHRLQEAQEQQQHLQHLQQLQQLHLQQQQQRQFQQETHRLHTSHSSRASGTLVSSPSHRSSVSSSPTRTARSTTSSLREGFPPDLERELSFLSIDDRGTGSPRAQSFASYSTEAVERVIEQPYYPPVPKLTSSPVTFTFNLSPPAVPAKQQQTVPTPPLPTIPSKIHSNAPNPATSPPSLPPPHSPLSYEQAQRSQQYRQQQEHLFSSSQVEEDQEEQHSGSSTESDQSSASSADEVEEDEDMSTSSTPASWISSFCSLQGHEYFAEVSEEFIEDDFNLTGLSSLVPLYKESLEMILDVEPDEDDDEPTEDDPDEDDSQLGGPVHKHRRSERTQADMETLESQAELLYGLIHQRFITSRQGMQIMYDKYQNNHFGFCPRVFCNSTRVLPCGYSDTPGIETVKLYCPSCMDMYVPPNSRFQSVDGAFFGTTFPSLFFLTFPDIEVGNHPPSPQPPLSAPPGYKPSPSQLKKKAEEDRAAAGGQRTINGVLENNIAPGLGRGKQYEMKIYGFKVNERARGGPRMKWLRSRPDDVAALDEAVRLRVEDDGEVGVKKEDGEDGEALGQGQGRGKERQAVERKPVRRSARRRP